jgi:peptidoglycan/xylan/chitin deacetylase (PgdA/CDA1 family)
MRKITFGVLMMLLAGVTFFASCGGRPAEREIRKALEEGKLIAGSPKEKLIAFTFDDGPNSTVTPLLLDVLKRNNVKATFFVVGKMVKQHPETTVRIVKEGHELANHSYSHFNMQKADLEDSIRDIIECNKVVEEVTGVKLKYFRPPGGRENEQLISGVAKLGMITTFWTINPGDYANPGVDFLVNHIVSRAHNGAIVLLHSTVQQTVDAMPRIIYELHMRGFRFVTLSELTNEIKKR